MCPEAKDGWNPGDPRESLRAEFLRGVVYGYQIGRDEGFGEGVRALHGVISKLLRDRTANGRSG